MQTADHAYTTPSIAPAMVGGEPRIHDANLAARIGLGSPQVLRDMIRRREAEIGRLGAPCTIGGEHYLNRRQAVFIAMVSGAKNATDIAIEIIDRVREITPH
ncbi:hypothetical protein AAC691_15465 [Nguyenibacter vanlangensis]|uniref:Uncharacterized protein n=1 Tax=Nguyenibacter vanlangensis TaxID=1216886 RepID=A0ABZ3D1P1_9PROT